MTGLEVEVPEEVLAGIAIHLRNIIRLHYKDQPLDETLALQYPHVLNPLFPVDFYIFAGLLTDDPKNDSLPEQDPRRIYHMTDKTLALLYIDDV